MKYKFKVGELVSLNSPCHGHDAPRRGDLGLVTGVVPGPIETHRDFRYTVLIEGVTYKLYGYELTKVSENNEL